jgi:hypothetical protein
MGLENQLLVRLCMETTSSLVLLFQVQMRLDCIRKGVPYISNGIRKSGELLET